MEVTLTLPDELAARAQAAGLLEDERMADVLQEVLERIEATRQFAAMTRQLRAVQPPITEAEIQAELDARKAERLAEPPESTT
jgi:hypothetical protein